MHLRDLPYEQPSFTTRGLYRLVRHPIYLGWLMIFWFTPTMTIAHLLFAVVTTVYILAAIRLEERDLINDIGPQYAAYRKRTRMITPLPKAAPKAAAMPAK